VKVDVRTGELREGRVVRIALRVEIAVDVEDRGASPEAASSPAA